MDSSRRSRGISLAADRKGWHGRNKIASITIAGSQKGKTILDPAPAVNMSSSVSIWVRTVIPWSPIAGPGLAIYHSPENEETVLLRGQSMISQLDPLLIAGVLVAFIASAAAILHRWRHRQPAIESSESPLGFWGMVGAVVLGNLISALLASLIYFLVR